MKHARPDYDRIQDPLGKIPEDEPVFLLRGQDILAPLTLKWYALQAAKKGLDLDLIEATLDQADRMENWQATVKRKKPDLEPKL